MHGHNPHQAPVSHTPCSHLPSCSSTTSQVLSAALQPDDLVQFGGAAGLKQGETLAPAPSADGQGEEGVVVGGSGNGVVYRFVERRLPHQQQGGKKAGGSGGGKKRAAVPAASASPAVSVVAGYDNASKRRRFDEEKEEEDRVGKSAEEVKELRAALVGATQGAEGIFKVRRPD